MAGLTSTGFSIKRLQEVIVDLQTAAQTEFSSLVSPGDIVNVSDTTVLGRWIKTLAPAITDLWEASQQVYSSFDINEATGVALENLTILGGVSRLTATATQALLVMSGVYGTSITSGSNVKSNVTGQVFSTPSTIILDENLAVGVQYEIDPVANNTTYSFTYKVDGFHTSPITVSYTSSTSASASSIVNGLVSEITNNHATYLTASNVSDKLSVVVSNLNYVADFGTPTNLSYTKAKKSILSSATVVGAIAADANTINNIQSPIVGWESAYNPFAGLIGTEDETDDELRNRYLVAKFQDSSTTYESLYSAILKVSGVKQVVIYENETDTAWTSPPVPAHSFYPIVLGGNSQSIAQAIWDNKPAGILSYGTVDKTVTDSQGVEHTVSFDRPTEVPIYVLLVLVKTEGWQDSNITNIKLAIVDHINNYKIGDDVIYSRLYTPANSYSGYYIDSLTIGLSSAPTGTSNISLDFNELANISTSNIIISVA